MSLYDVWRASATCTGFATAAAATTATAITPATANATAATAATAAAAAIAIIPATATANATSATTATAVPPPPSLPRPTPRSTFPPMSTVELTRMKIQRMLTGPMGLRVVLEGDAVQIRFNDASTHLRIRVLPWGTNEEGEPSAAVLITAPILYDVPVSPGLFEWVAREGGSRWFGHVEVHGEEGSETVQLVFSHTLLGDYLDQPELEAAMWGILQVADGWDDELQERFRGRRWIDV